MRAWILSVAAGGVFGLASMSIGATVSITDSPISGPNGTAGVDYYVYKFVGPSTLSRDDAHPLSTALQGSAPPPSNAPFGNVELFANSESGTYSPSVALGDNFQTATRIAFSGTLLGVGITLSSLNGDDWFRTPGNVYDTTYAADTQTLARKWFGDLMTFYNVDGILTSAGVVNIALEKQQMFDTIRNGGGFQRISDPNISYVNQDTGTHEVSIGLAGTQGFLKQGLLAYIAASGTLTPAQKASIGAAVNALDIQASELVRVEYAGGAPMYLYGFTAQAVDLATDDQTESYDQNFNVTFQGMPEPSSAGLLGLAGALGLRRRRPAR